MLDWVGSSLDPTEEPLSVQSILLLVLVTSLLAVPGIAASSLAFPPEVPVVTWAAAVFGLGYAACGGCAFLLAAAHAFRLSLFLLLWAVVSAVLWVVAVLRRGALPARLHALADGLRLDWLPLLLGALVVAALVVSHLKFLHVLGAPRYVYYLSGIETANSGGVPASTLEYGQAWPPATDKAMLDAFTGVVFLLNHNVAIGPGVLLLISILGTALGLWATAWELGLHRTGVLLAVLVVANQVIFNTVAVSGHGPRYRHSAPISTDFTEYHAQDFGRAVAFCALAMGIYAIRQRRWGPAVAAGLVLASASATHLVPVIVVVIALGVTALAGLIGNGARPARLVTLRQVAVVAAVSAAVGVLVRVFAGGSFGLGGASNPGSYATVGTRFDPTAYLFTGKFMPLAHAGTGHWYIPPGQVVADILAGMGIIWPPWAMWLLLAGCVLAAVSLFLLAPKDLRTVGIVGAGLLAGLIAVSLLFAYHYHVYVDATFGVRRLKDYASLGFLLIGLGLLELLLLRLGQVGSRLSLTLTVVLVVAVSAWVLPVSISSPELGRVSHERVVLINWIRTHTPCNARFLVSQRTEGTLTALTGRFALLEGMGPFLRPDKLQQVIPLFLSARRFFRSPQSNEAFLREHDITYVVITRQDQLLGYSGPTGTPRVRAIHAAPFLHPVLTTPAATVYLVQGARMLPVSPLLTGPYLHCITTRVHY